MITMILLLVGVAYAHHPAPDHYFETTCARYLILDDPKVFEREETTDLEIYRDVTKARVFMYGHPLDEVLLKFVEAEIESRAILETP